MFFKDIQPGTFFVYEGWIMLKIKLHRGYNAVIFKPSGKPQVDVSDLDLIGVLTSIQNNEEIERNTTTLLGKHVKK